MSDASGPIVPGSDAATANATANVQTDPPVEPTVDDLKAELDKLRAEARKWERNAKTNDEKAKANGAAAAELQRLQRAQMTEHEQAVEKARLEGEAAAREAFAGPLVSMALRAAAAGRLDSKVLDELADTINVARLLKSDGTVDMDRVSTLIEGLVPPPAPKDEGPPPDPRFPEIGGQGRTAPALNGNDLLDSLKAAVGVQ